MNCCYAIIRLANRESVVVAPELARSRARSEVSFWLRSVGLALVGFTLLGFGTNRGLANTGLVDPSVKQGSASVHFNQASGTVVRQMSNNAVIDWRSFSLASGERLEFVQPGRDAITLNRVTGQQASSIHGELLANGQVWLLNPNGVLIGSSGRINTHGFLASTLWLSADNFMQGNYTFQADPAVFGSVVNQGDIISAQAGYAVLAGRQVRNDGLIQAQMGQVVLGAGRAATLDLVGDGLLSFAVTAPVEDIPAQGEALIENTGHLSANGGRVLIAAQAATDIMRRVINVQGVVEATSLREVNGDIVLEGGPSGTVTVSGELNASGTAVGEQGGAVKVFGQRLHLQDGAVVNTTGDAGGGDIFVGGGWQGASVEGRRSAIEVQIDAGASLDASALANGNGGTVVAWSDVGNRDSKTHALGSFKARGGPRGGDGGRIETSGFSLVADPVSIDSSAKFGQSGLWLLDPDWIRILPDDSSDATGYNPSTADYSLIKVSTLNQALSVANVVISTGNTPVSPSDLLVRPSGSQSAQGHITIGCWNESGGCPNSQTLIEWSAPTNLTISAAASIHVLGLTHVKYTGASPVDIKLEAIGLSDTVDGGRVYIAGVAPSSAVDDFIQAPNANVYIDFVSYGNAGNNHLNFAARGISSKNITLSGSANNNLLLGRKLSDTAGLSLGDIRRLHASDTLTVTTRNTSESDYGWLTLDVENGIPFSLAAGDLLGNLVLKNSKVFGVSGTSIALSSGKTLTLDTMNTAGDGFYTTISGDTKLVKRGVGTLVLSAANTYTGGTSIQEGVLKLSANANFYPSIEVVGGGALDLNGYSLELGSSMGPASLTLSGVGPNGTLGALTNTYIGTESGRIAGIFPYQGLSPGITSHVVLKAPGTTDVNEGATIGGPGGGDGSMVIGVPIVDSSGANNRLEKAGDGTLTLNAQNSYSGGTVVKGGTLEVGSHISNGTLISYGNLGSPANSLEVQNSAQLRLNLTDPNNNVLSVPVGSLSGQGTLNIVTGAFSVGSNNQDSSFTGKVEGYGSFEKIGTGRLVTTLPGTSATRVSGGVLALASSESQDPQTAPWGPVEVNGGTLDLNGYSLSPARSLAIQGIASEGALTNSGTSANALGEIHLTGPTKITDGGAGIGLGFVEGIEFTTPAPLSSIGSDNQTLESSSSTSLKVGDQVFVLACSSASCFGDHVTERHVSQVASVSGSTITLVKPLSQTIQIDGITHFAAVTQVAASHELSFSPRTGASSGNVILHSDVMAKSIVAASSFAIDARKTFSGDVIDQHIATMGDQTYGGSFKVTNTGQHEMLGSTSASHNDQRLSLISFSPTGASIRFEGGIESSTDGQGLMFVSTWPFEGEGAPDSASITPLGQLTLQGDIGASNRLAGFFAASGTISFDKKTNSNPTTIRLKGAGVGYSSLGLVSADATIKVSSAGLSLDALDGDVFIKGSWAPLTSDSAPNLTLKTNQKLYMSGSVGASAEPFGDVTLQAETFRTLDPAIKTCSLDSSVVSGCPKLSVYGKGNVLLTATTLEGGIVDEVALVESSQTTSPGDTTTTSPGDTTTISPGDTPSPSPGDTTTTSPIDKAAEEEAARLAAEEAKRLEEEAARLAAEEAKRLEEEAARLAAEEAKRLEEEAARLAAEEVKRLEEEAARLAAEEAKRLEEEAARLAEQIKESGGTLDADGAAEVLKIAESTGLDLQEIAEASKNLGATEIIKAAEISTSLGVDFNAVAQATDRLGTDLVEQAAELTKSLGQNFTDVAQVIEKAPVEAVTSLASVASKTGGSLTEVLEKATEETTQSVRVTQPASAPAAAITPEPVAQINNIEADAPKPAPVTDTASATEAPSAAVDQSPPPSNSTPEGSPAEVAGGGNQAADSPNTNADSPAPSGGPVSETGSPTSLQAEEPIASPSPPPPSAPSPESAAASASPAAPPPTEAAVAAPPQATVESAPAAPPPPETVVTSPPPPPPPPVAPPPPSPVPTAKPPTPVDTADAGDKTLASVAPPEPPKPAEKPQRSPVKTVTVVPGGVVNVQVPVPPRPPATSGLTQKLPSLGNSARW